MAQKSILDFEEARQRLQRMEQEQAALLELISKLKTLVQKAEGRTKDVGERLAAADERLAEAKATAKSLKAAMEELRQQSAKTLAEVESFRKKAGDDLKAAAGEVRQQSNKAIAEMEACRRKANQDATAILAMASERIAELETTLNEKQTRWCEQQQAAFTDFHKRHLEALDELTKAYDRQKIVYDSIKAGAETVQAGLDKMSSELRGEVGRLRTEVNQKVESVAGSLESRMQAWMTGVHEEVNSKVRGLEQRNDRLQVELNRKSRRIWLGFVALCVLLVITAVFAGYSAIRISSNASSTPARLWMDQTGKYTVEATFEGCTDGTVQLRKSNGTVVNVPLKRLSEEDQEQVKRLTDSSPSK
jgi:chromosome segregation ATPase